MRQLPVLARRGVRVLGLTVVAALAVVAPGNATGVLDVSQPVATPCSCGGDEWAGVDGVTMVGQTFTARTTGVLDQVDLLLGVSGSPGDLSVKIESVAAGVPTDTVLAAATVPQGSVAGGWLSVPFSSGVAVTAGTQYAIVLYAPNATQPPDSPPNSFLSLFSYTNYYKWSEAEDSPYPDGMEVYSFAGTNEWHPEAAPLDTAFKTYVEPAGSVTTTAAGGDTVTTDPGNTGATTDVPVQTQLALPTGLGPTPVSIALQTTVDPAPSGFSFFGRQVVIDDGGATTTSTNPFVVTFTIDASLLSGVAPADVQLFRDGVALASCTDPVAAVPDACIAAAITVAGGDAAVTARTTHFSKWNFGRLAYRFGGFLEPVDQLPTVNTTKAGSAIPVKFSLGGNRGLTIFQAGYPAQATYSCRSGAPTDTIEQTVTAGGSSLSYNTTSDTYTYVWKTDKAWAATCRELTLKFRDGTSQLARFQFTK